VAAHATDGPRYAVECQSSYERGAAGEMKKPLACVSQGVTRMMAADIEPRAGLAPPCVATEGRHAMDSDSPGRSWPFSLLSHAVPGAR
jgi:hypothetical protein